jgi:(1->4)-alpha-D-glucan 1-alpha-D-glucosylmutase
LIKALREAKTHTNWLRPNEQYERQVLEFVDRITDPERSERFLKQFLAFQKKVAYFGAINSLSQTLLKIASPGIPDFYRGVELWDLNLADPDNRRPVDFEVRMKTLAQLHDSKPKELLRHWQDGRIKLFLIWKALNFRRQNVDLFLSGDYIPIASRGAHAANVIAFARRKGRQLAIVVVPRLSSQITRSGRPPRGDASWSDTSLIFPEYCPGELYDIFTGKLVSSRAVSMIFSDFPFSLLHTEI